MRKATTALGRVYQIYQIALIIEGSTSQYLPIQNFQSHLLTFGAKLVALAENDAAHRWVEVDVN